MNSHCKEIKILLLVVLMGLARAEDEMHFDVNDVAFLFPTPGTVEDVASLISGDDKLADGATCWPEKVFKKVIDSAKKDAAKVNGTAIQFAEGLEDLHNWKVAGIRVNPASLGGSDGMIAGLQKS